MSGGRATSPGLTTRHWSALSLALAMTAVCGVLGLWHLQQTSTPVTARLSRNGVVVVEDHRYRIVDIIEAGADRLAVGELCQVDTGTVMRHNASVLHTDLAVLEIDGLPRCVRIGQHERRGAAELAVNEPDRPDGAGGPSTTDLTVTPIIDIWSRLWVPSINVGFGIGISVLIGLFVDLIGRD